jgi:hypothetical protein
MDTETAPQPRLSRTAFIPRMSTTHGVQADEKKHATVLHLGADTESDGVISLAQRRAGVNRGIGRRSTIRIGVVQPRSMRDRGVLTRLPSPVGKSTLPLASY